MEIFKGIRGLNWVYVGVIYTRDKGKFEVSLDCGPYQGPCYPQ